MLVIVGHPDRAHGRRRVVFSIRNASAMTEPSHNTIAAAAIRALKLSKHYQGVRPPEVDDGSAPG